MERVVVLFHLAGKSAGERDWIGPCCAGRGEMDVASLFEQCAAMPVEIVDFFDCPLDPIDQLARQASSPGPRAAPRRGRRRLSSAELTPSAPQPRASRYST